MDNCPMDGIDMTIDPPIIANPCMKCRFCLRICPTGALVSLRDKVLHKWPADAMSIRRKLLWEHYLGPLAKAEAEGRLRRLIPVDKIGWDTYIYNVYKKHPYWIIGKGLTYKTPMP